MRGSKLLCVIAGLVGGCGGGAKHVRCTGSGCLQVAGAYSGTIKTGLPSDTCQAITYSGTQPNTPQSSSMTFSISQDATDPSKVSFDFGAQSFRLTVDGELFQDGTASFEEHLPHVAVVDLSNGSSKDYSDDTSVQLTFTKAGSAMQVSGSLRDALKANESVQTDSFCRLSGQINATR